MSKAIQEQPSPKVSPQQDPRHIESTSIFHGERQVVIEHAGQEYRLSITRNDKLILQK